MFTTFSSSISLWCCFLSFLLLIQCASTYQELSDATLSSLPRPHDDFDIHTGKILSPILRTRVSGTPGSAAVQEHFRSFFQKNLPDWHVEWQNSTAKTPVTGNKEIPFVNFIASRDPPWAAKGDVGRLTLVAHYDSKLKPDGFIGAIDSAAPCAMIIHAMRSIDGALTQKWAAMEADGVGTDFARLDEHTGIQVLFLDGEEAFKDWTATDSLYGARSLAETWETTAHPAVSIFKTPLSSISLFVLLDLLGSKDPQVHSYFPTTHWAYQALGKLETRLRSLKQFKSSLAESEKEAQWLVDTPKSERDLRQWGMGIEDDHLPFLRRGVEILHLIGTTRMRGFPAVWHTLNDDGEHLDLPTVEDWSTLITAFAAEWMELEGFFDEPAASTTRAEPVEGRRTRKTEL
jgi:hypothetical protein